MAITLTLTLTLNLTLGLALVLALNLTLGLALVLALALTLSRSSSPTSPLSRAICCVRTCYTLTSSTPGSCNHRNRGCNHI